MRSAALTHLRIGVPPAASRNTPTPTSILPGRVSAAASAIRAISESCACSRSRSSSSGRPVTNASPISASCPGVSTPMTLKKLTKLTPANPVDETSVSRYSHIMNAEFHLDAIDRRIARALQREATLSHAALAETVGASAASVWRRVRNLEKEGVLGAAVQLADPGRLGRSVNVLCQVRMTRQTTDARDEFERFIQSREEIVECYA